MCRLTVSSGFSLIEVLVSVIIVTIGLLGLIKLQLTSLQSTNHAHLITSASIAVVDLAERMRLNPSGIENRRYEGTVNISSCSHSVKSCEGDNVCSFGDVAAYDVNSVTCGRAMGNQQSGGIFYQLPNASLSITCHSSPCDIDVEHTISIEWYESDTTVFSKIRRYELSFIP